jgi:hypothetical protein
MNFTGVELLRRVDKRGEEKRTGKPITKKIYCSVLPSRGELSPVSATVNRRVLQAFKITGVAKERRIKIGIALDAAPLPKTLSLFTVSIIVCDPDAIDPKTGKKISKLFARYVNYCIHVKRFTNNSRSFQSRQSRRLHPQR